MHSIKLTPTLRRRDALKLTICATLLSFGALSGCVIQDDKPPAPQGRLKVIHANPQEGSIEVLLDEEVILTVTPGQISEVVTLPQGELELTLRKPGAMSSYATTEAIDFGDELNVLALAADDEILYLTDDAPMATEDTHYVRVLDLSGQDDGMMMFRGSSEITALPLEERISPFIPTDPDDEERSYTLSRLMTDDDGEQTVGGPYSVQEAARVSSPAGGATLVIVQPADDTSNDFKVTPVNLR